MFIHPHPDPVAFSLFGLISIRWYGLMYLTGLLIAFLMGRWLLKKPCFESLQRISLEDIIVAAALGIIIGGRIGSVVFYNLDYYINHPIDIFRIWTGGMSFHGGLIGVIVSLWVITLIQEKKINSVDATPESAKAPIFLRLVDFAAVLTPPGLGLGRLGNFINGELPGRIADNNLPWAFNFGYPDSLARHPSQLYQMIMEGVILTCLMLWFARKHQPDGRLSGIFLCCYAVGRIITEFFREPDGHIGLLLFGLSMGQWLSFPMLLLGIVLIYSQSLINIRQRYILTKSATVKKNEHETSNDTVNKAPIPKSKTNTLLNSDNLENKSNNSSLIKPPKNWLRVLSEKIFTNKALEQDSPLDDSTKRKPRRLKRHHKKKNSN